MKFASSRAILDTIVEVTRVNRPDEVNPLLTSGWVLLSASDDGYTFVLGRPRAVAPNDLSSLANEWADKRHP